MIDLNTYHPFWLLSEIIFTPSVFYYKFSIATLLKSEIKLKWKSKVCSKSWQTSKMVPFAKIANGFQILTIFAEDSILDVGLSFEYACGSERYHLHCTKNP